MVEQTELTGSGTRSGIVAIFATLEASTRLVSKSLVGPTAPEATRAAPTKWVHGTMWKKSEKSARAAKTNAHLMIDRAPVGQPVPSEYEGG